MSEPTSQPAIATHTAALLDNLKKASLARVPARVFRSNIASMRYVFKTGKVAAFLNFKYATDIAYEIDELDFEIAVGHPNITANKEEVVETIEPLEVLKKKHFEEFLKAQATAVSKDNDAGTSDQGKLNVANSRTVGEGMAGSDSSATAPTAGIKISLPTK